jgi:beta-lactamase regulating signal transducer with metallopeptidase domain
MGFFAEILWLSLLSEFLIKSSILLSFAILMSFFCRRQSASLRHFILSFTLIGLLLFPVLSSVKTGWKTRLLPSFHNEDPSYIFNGSMSFSGTTPSPLTAGNGLDMDHRNGETSALKSSKPARQYVPFHTFVKYCFLITWIFVFASILFRHIFGLYGAFRITKEAEDIKDPFWRHLLHSFLDAISLKKRVSLLRHTKVKVPLTWGWLKPVVIMPTESKFWSLNQRSSALLHELSHIKRGDFLVMMLARISLSLFWFNPLSWVVFHMMKKEQEKACDELVLNTGIKPSDYAADLLSIRKSIQVFWTPPGAVLEALGRSQLNDRLITILKKKYKMKEVKMRSKIFLSVFVILTIAFLGMARPFPSRIAAENGHFEDVMIPDRADFVPLSQEKEEKKKDQEKADKKAKKEKKKDVFVWHMKEGDKGEVKVIISDKGNVKTFTLKEPVIIIKKDDTGKEIAWTSNGKSIEIKGDDARWIVKGDELTFQKELKEIELGEGSVIRLKTRTKDGHEVIEIEGPIIAVTEEEEPSEHITIEISDEEGGEKAVVVAPRVHVELPDVEVHPDVRLRVKEHELQKIHDRLQKIHEKLSKDMESKTEEEEQALMEMAETLKKLEKKIEKYEETLKDITVSIHEKPHIVAVGQESDVDKGGESIIFIEKEEGHIKAFIDEKGQTTFLARMRLEKDKKSDFADAVTKIEEDLPEGYEVKSAFNENTGDASLTIRGTAKNKDTQDVVINLLKELKKKLEKSS